MTPIDQLLALARNLKPHTETIAKGFDPFTDIIAGMPETLDTPEETRVRDALADAMRSLQVAAWALDAALADTITAAEDFKKVFGRR